MRLRNRPGSSEGYRAQNVQHTVQSRPQRGTKLITLNDPHDPTILPDAVRSTSNPVATRLLVVELADIGDLLVATPALAALRETFPTAFIDVLTTPHAAPILTGTGLADQVTLFDKATFDRPVALLKPRNARAALALAVRLRRGNYDAVLILHRLTTRFGALKYAALAFASGAPRRLGLDNGRGWFLTDHAPDEGFGVKHQARYWLDVVALLGAKASDQRLRIGISETDRAWARTHLPDAPRRIAIHPGSGGFSLARRWEADKFAALADQLIEQDAAVQIVIVGGARDDSAAVIAAMHHAPLDLTGQTTLNQLAAVLALCDHYYGADSGVMHLATAAGVPVTALFGPSNHAAWGPWAANAKVIRTGVRCSPCSYVGNTVGSRDGCPARTCMKTLSVAQVISGTTAQNTPRHAQTRPHVTILGLPVHAITFAGMLDQIGDWLQTDQPHQICTVNPEFLMTAQSDNLFYNILSRADLCIPDGIGLLWAARHLGSPLPERVTGSDGVPLIAERAARDGWKLFFLGAAPGVAQEAARRLSERYPGLQVVGCYAGSPDPAEEDGLVERINQSGADILFVAYGAPIQDKWIARNLPRLQPRVALGVGGAFDFVAGVTQRAPPWMRRLGIEWLHRLIQQPWRWRRMTRLPRFMVAVLTRGARGPARFVAHHTTPIALQSSFKLEKDEDLWNSKNNLRN